MTKLIIFDLDGVLLDSRELHYESLNEALRKVGDEYVITRDEHLSLYDGLNTTKKLDMLTERKGLPKAVHQQIWEDKQKATFELMKRFPQDGRAIDVFRKIRARGKDFDTNGLVALEYGCGPGRNLIRFANRFARIDGVDIAQNNLVAAETNLKHHGIAVPNLYHNDGSTLPMISDETYDVAFSVICLQHIACYDIRFSILKEIHRVLKPGGRFCFQIGFGGRPAPHKCTPYFENGFDAKGTNGWHDVAVESEDQLTSDLIDKIGFRNYKSDIGATGPGDQHRQWIWVQVEK